MEEKRKRVLIKCLKNRKSYFKVLWNANFLKYGIKGKMIVVLFFMLKFYFLICFCFYKYVILYLIIFVYRV